MLQKILHTATFFVISQECKKVEFVIHIYFDKPQKLFYRHIFQQFVVHRLVEFHFFDGFHGRFHYFNKMAKLPFNKVLNKNRHSYIYRSTETFIGIASLNGKF